VADIPVGDTPTSVTVGRGAVRVLNADDRTITRVDLPGERAHTVAIGAIPTDAAADGDTL
jgi:hypothetical protein